MEFTFAEWMKEIDDILFAKFGLEFEDLVDQNWHSFFENEYTPIEAIEILFENEYVNWSDLLGYE